MAVFENKASKNTEMYILLKESNEVKKEDLNNIIIHTKRKLIL